MSADYLYEHLQTPTPQSEPLREDQVLNSAGGYSWQIDPWQQLQRFLILGSEGGTYYISQRDLTKVNLEGCKIALQTDPDRFLDEVVDVSVQGRAAKNEPAILCLAMACASSDVHVRRKAMEKIPVVCRTATHLFTFLNYVTSFRGWGRMLKRNVAAWYTGKTPNQLAYQVIKYRNREGWTHHNVLQMAHPSSDNDEIRDILGWIAWQPPKDDTEDTVRPRPSNPLIQAFEEVQSSDVSTEHKLMLLKEHNLPWETLPTELLTHKETWQTLLSAGMPLTALVRNLANMTRHGAIDAFSPYTDLVVSRLSDEEGIRASKIHPLQLIAAKVTYDNGTGYRARGTTWEPIARVSEALEQAFYLAFQNVPESSRRTMLALDISGSMGGWKLSGMPMLSAAMGAAVMAMVTARSTPKYSIVGFSTSLISLRITAGTDLNSVLRITSRYPFGGTDCAQPMLYAQKKKLEVDTFVVYTDDETWYGSIHPAKALENYRKASKIDARLVVVGMVGNPFTIADPKDPGMLDVVGFDTSAPRVIQQFSEGIL